MQPTNTHYFDVERFLKNCTDLEEAYEILVIEKKETELKLQEVTSSLQELKELYEKEKRKNLEISEIVSDETDRLLEKQNYREQYEEAKKRTEDLKRIICDLKRKNENERENVMEQIKIEKRKMQEELKEYENQMRFSRNKILELEKKVEQLHLEISSKDAEIRRLHSTLGELHNQHAIQKLEYENKIKLFAREQEENNKRMKDSLRSLKNGENNLAFIHMKNKVKSIEQEYSKLEQEHIKLKKSISKHNSKIVLSTTEYPNIYSNHSINNSHPM